MWQKKGVSGSSKSSMGERAVHGRFSSDPRSAANLKANEKNKPIAANEDESSARSSLGFVSGIIASASDYSSQLVSHFVAERNSRR